MYRLDRDACRDKVGGLGYTGKLALRRYTYLLKGLSGERFDDMIHQSGELPVQSRSRRFFMSLSGGEAYPNR